ncbi:MAG: PAS-domain containing protein [Nisaea sp.]|uniref:PAS-domain containing protein n=1 Tax=Nisaea sp. TaxID=2024842 RepID=UPI001B174BAD|nr:PAS-domain containing protein [Nisaea sp.]MBO6561946.1 PAS-domain containing protein [Nisaea sp.]
MVDSLLGDLSVLVILVILQAVVETNSDKLGRFKGVFSGILFGATACLVMLVPFHLGNGIIFDARSAILALAPVFGGPAGGIAAGLMGSATRLYIGGGGAVTGTIAIWFAIGGGTLFYYLISKKNKGRSFLGYLLLGVAVNGATLLLFWAMLGSAITLQIGPIMFGFNTISTGLLGWLLQEFYDLRRDKQQTEQARAEASEQLAILKGAFENFPDAIFVLDRNFRVTATNDRFYEMLELPKERFPLGSSHFDFLAFNKSRGDYVEDNIVGDESSLMAQLDRGTLTEYERTRPNGTVLRVKSFPLPEGGFVRTVEDVTALRAQERRKRDTEAQLSAIRDISTAYMAGEESKVLYERILRAVLALTESEFGFVGDLYRDEDCKPYLRCNAISDLSWASGTSYTPGEIITDPIVYRNLDTLFGHVIATGETLISNAPAAHPRSGGLPEGHPPLNAFLGLPIRVGGKMIGMFGLGNRAGGYNAELAERLGNFTQTVGLIISGINDRLARNAAERERDKNHQRLRLAVESSNLGLWEYDPDSNTTIYSDIWRKQIGYEGTEFPTSRLAWREQVHPDDFAAVSAAFQRSVTHPFPPYRAEYRLRHRDGSYRWILSQGSMEFGASGKPTRMLGITSDITEIRGTEEALHQSRKMEAIGQLTAGIAHDFNNILAIILGNLELMEETIADPVNKSLLSTAVKATARGADLTSQLLAFGRRAPLKPEEIDINNLVEELCPLLQRTLGSGVKIKQELCTGPTPVLVDKSQLENAIINLAINGRDAMSDGGVLTITTQLMVIDQKFAASRSLDLNPGGYIVIGVKDVGCGMDSAILSRVFEPFFTTKPNGRGSGLGLSMVYGFLKQSGGSAVIHSDPGMGTSVQLFLAVSKTKSAINPCLQSGAIKKPAMRSLKVLVLEDEDAVREIVCEVLKSLGMQPVGAKDGSEALSMVRNHVPYDLLLCDVSLAGPLSGPETVQLIREIDPDAKALFMSGYPGGDEITRKIAPHDRLIQKPVGRLELQAAIEDSISGERDIKV